MNHILARVALLVAALSLLPSQAAAWTTQPSSSTSVETWLIGDDGTGKFAICNTTTGTYVTWPTGSAPANPMTENGTINMRGGSDYLRIITNDGPYACGYMYRIQYSTYTLTLVGGSGNDSVIGGNGPDLMFGDSNDIDICLEDSGGDDYLASGGGADEIHGCGGDDVFDTFYAPGASTVVYGDWGADCLESASGVTVVCGDSSAPYSDGYVDEYDTAGSTACDGVEDTAYSSPALNCS